MKFETIAIHGGYTPEPTTKSVAVPIYQTTSYSFDDTQHGADLFDLKVAGNIYTRIMNPTSDVLEKRVAAMEGGIGALALASGSAATTYAIMTICEAGDNIVSTSTLYGGTYTLFAHQLPRFGVDVKFGDHDDIPNLEKLIDKKTKAIFCESIMTMSQSRGFSLTIQGWNKSSCTPFGTYGKSGIGSAKASSSPITTTVSQVE